MQLNVFSIPLPFGLAELTLTLVSVMICTVMVILGRVQPRLSGRVADLSSVQAMHVNLTPRVGGIGIFAAILISILFAPQAAQDNYLRFVLATSPLFVTGLIEDLGYGISPRGRLLAAMIASLAVVLLLEIWMPRTGIPGLDVVASHWAIGIPLTLLVTAGVANGFNLIDGVNGLAGVTAIGAAIALALIAHEAGYERMVPLATMVAAAVLGFLLLNYPFGRIFLGDAGAYTLGFVLSWFGVAILFHVPTASPWAILLTVFWPVADTLLAVYRRSRRNLPTMAPDRLHVHQLVMRALEIFILGRNKRRIANPLTTLILMPFILLPPLTGYLLWDKSGQAFIAVMLYGTVFAVGYLVAVKLCERMMRHRRKPCLQDTQNQDDEDLLASSQA
jgi:UDP-GlcNAc:undecaprenyl-phosphate/decaprenyl-phosphate GlcNAc-1-phosphate transferase